MGKHRTMLVFRDAFLPAWFQLPAACVLFALPPHVQLLLAFGGARRRHLRACPSNQTGVRVGAPTKTNARALSHPIVFWFVKSNPFRLQPGPKPSKSNLFRARRQARPASLLSCNLAATLVGLTRTSELVDAGKVFRPKIKFPVSRANTRRCEDARNPKSYSDHLGQTGTNAPPRLFA